MHSRRPPTAPDLTTMLCPICGGGMDKVYERNQQKVLVCVDCQAGLTVPDSAWEIAQRKRENGEQP